jgi:hypothetical protein
MAASRKKPARKKNHHVGPNSVQVYKRGGNPSHLDNPLFVARAIGFASEGLPRTAVAALLGISHPLLYGWLERGRASEREPYDEPYRSFAESYLRAERGLMRAGMRAGSLRVMRLVDAEEAYARWLQNPVGKPPEVPSSSDMTWLALWLQQRWPQDLGSTAHRQLEQEPSGTAYVERRGLQREQLLAIARDPPPEILEALRAVGWLAPRDVSRVDPSRADPGDSGPGVATPGRTASDLPEGDDFNA